MGSVFMSPVTFASHHPLTGPEDPPGEKFRGLAGCYALFQYLTVGIEAANAVYSQARERMEALHHTLTHNTRSVGEKDGRAADASRTGADSSHTQDSVSRLASDCEAIAFQQAALLKYHKSVSVFPLATVRETLTSALSTWPNSAPLWSIYVQVSCSQNPRVQNPLPNYCQCCPRDPRSQLLVTCLSGGESVPQCRSCTPLFPFCN